MITANKSSKLIAIQHIYLVFISGAWITLFIWAKRSIQSDFSRINSMLEWLSPLAFLLSAFVLFFSIVKRLLLSHVGFRLRSKNCVLLACILFMSAGFRIGFIPHTERLYYDEHCYKQLAYGAAEEGRLKLASYATIEKAEYTCKIGTYPHWSPGWPTLLGLCWKPTGYSKWAPMILNIALSLLTQVFIAGISWILWRGSKAWLFACILYGCLPDNIIWSLTSASETAGALWITLSFLCAICFTRKHEDAWGYMLVGAISLAVYTRNEFITLLPAHLLIIVCLGGFYAIRKTMWFSCMLITLLLPQSLHLGVTSKAYDHYLVIEDAIFGVQHVWANLSSLFEHLRQEPVLISILCLAFIVLVKIKSEKAILPFIIWIISIVFVTSFHFGARYTYPGGSRFVLSWLPILCILAGYSLHLIHLTMNRVLNQNVQMLLVGIFFLMALLQTISYAAENDQATQIPRSDVAFLRICIRDIPANSMVVSSNPSIMIAEGISSVSLYHMMNDRDVYNEVIFKYSNCLYFYSCPSLLPHQSGQGKEMVEQFLEMFQARVISEQTDHYGKRSFYQLQQ